MSAHFKFTFFLFLIIEACLKLAAQQLDTVNVITGGIRVDSVKMFYVYRCNKNFFWITLEENKNKSNCMTKFLMHTSNGTRITYYRFYKTKRGPLQYEGYWNDEVLDGYFRENHSNGVIKSEGVYFFGKKIGLWQYYNINGQVDKTEQYGDPDNVLGSSIIYPILE